MSPDEVAAVVADRDELLGMVRAVVDGVESVNDGGLLVSTRLPEGLLARMTEVASR
jgi:hypothetical protein